MNGNQSLLWKLKVPPKIKNLFWRYAEGVCPNALIFVHDICALCNEDEEDSRHIFFDCPSSRNIWSMCSFNNVVLAGLRRNLDASELIFELLQQLTAEDATFMTCVVWSIWKQRNNRMWNSVTNAQSFVYSCAATVLTEWREVQIARGIATVQQTEIENRWRKPSSGRVKSNIDAAFSSNFNRVGIGICIRDEFDVYVAAKYDQYTPIRDIQIGEALGLLSTLNWVHVLNLGPVDFELDSKLVVDNFHSNKVANTEFGEIIAHFKISGELSNTP